MSSRVGGRLHGLATTSPTYVDWGAMLARRCHSRSTRAPFLMGAVLLALSLGLPGLARAEEEDPPARDLLMVAAGLDAARSLDQGFALAGERAATRLGPRRSIAAVLARWADLSEASRAVARRLFRPWREDLLRERRAVAGDKVKLAATTWLLAKEDSPLRPAAKDALIAQFGDWSSATESAVQALAARMWTDRTSEGNDAMVAAFRKLQETSGGEALPAALFLLRPRRLAAPSAILDGARIMLRGVLNASHEQGLIALLDDGWRELSELVLLHYASEEALAAILRAAGRGDVLDGAASGLILRWPKGLDEAMDACFRTLDTDRGNPGVEVLLKWVHQTKADFLRRSATILVQRSRIETGAEWPAALNRERWAILAAIAALQLGEQRMFPHVIDALGISDESFNAHLRHEAGEVLDRLSGRSWFASDPERAHAWYRAWWREYGTRLAWNAETMSYGMEPRRRADTRDD